MEPRLYQALALKVALKTYGLHKVQVNSAWTPKRMMALATKITGRSFRPRDYLGASQALHDIIHAHDQEPHHG